MADGYKLQAQHIARINAMLAWYERKGHTLEQAVELLLHRRPQGRTLGGGGKGLRCNALLAAAMLSSAETGVVDNIVCTDGGTFDESHPDYSSGSGQLTVYNYLNDTAANNDPCKIELNKSEDSVNGEAGDGRGRWEFVRVPSTTTEITVLTAHQWDGTNHKLQYKSRTAKVVDPGTESGWTDEDTAVSCP